MKTIVELRDQIKSWSERADIPDAQIDHFIYLVESDYKEEFFSPVNEHTVTLTADANGEVAIPFDYIRGKHLYSLATDGTKTIIRRKPNEVVVYGGETYTTGTPCFFERVAANFVFSPKPVEDDTVSLIYYRLIPSLTDLADGETNAVLEVAPLVYLFGALYFLHEYTFNEERASYYSAKYERAKQDFIALKDKEEMTGSSLAVFPTISEGDY